jgi:hypothetical protein
MNERIDVRCKDIFYRYRKLSAKFFDSDTHTENLQTTMAPDNEMASVLKRKRSSMEVVEAQKRAKSTQGAEGRTPPLGSASDGTVKRILESPEAFERGPLLEDQLNGTGQNLEWQLSAPIGGRMTDVDPVFTQDEK